MLAGLEYSFVSASYIMLNQKQVFVSSTGSEE